MKANVISEKWFDLSVTLDRPSEVYHILSPNIAQGFSISEEFCRFWSLDLIIHWITRTGCKNECRIRLKIKALYLFTGISSYVIPASYDILFTLFLISNVHCYVMLFLFTQIPHIFAKQICMEVYLYLNYAGLSMHDLCTFVQ